LEIEVKNNLGKKLKSLDLDPSIWAQDLNSDLSAKGIEQSKGVMVNYLYDLDALEENHELFFKTKKVQQSGAITSLRKKLQIH